MSALFHNEDCTNFFYFNDTTEGKGGAVLDRYIDVIPARQAWMGEGFAPPFSGHL